MLFHTWTFFCFFAVVLIGLILLRKTPFWVHWILGSSYFFYGWWNYYYLALIIYSTALDFFTVRQMERPGTRKKLWLWISIINNLSLLGFFKYADFFISNINDLTGLNLSSASEIMPFGLDYLLPVGISFYTFQSMSYTIDYYRGKIKRETSFIRFAAFVSSFLSSWPDQSKEPRTCFHSFINFLRSNAKTSPPEPLFLLSDYSRN